ncbi:MAG TPA: bifunctional phosphopantothenoylcysteine decarboxylase/phosphopantothenate--cysteine ligase CoaBC [Hyphomonadaceae bacterium]|nr:bifunctional phosphopantothenoylcysteine decarboxylase/phosphopantothenate--cysteine ligase CoaBC [Hyphomonadaceae bacterium]HPN04910.1 bifunctional phosphopantothenoylcysteine decarboxylase/phosphopantothenate--cysteine ligase CoaBC [Hyphomonadaceae bacterium]
MNGKRILLIVGGGIAAYKSLELIRLLAKEGIATRVILTKSGAEFVTPLSLGSLSGDKVYQELFNLTDESEMGHIELSRSADLVVVAPATADLMAKAANGLANDLASTTLLATDKPVLMAPAMNVRMWEHAATQRNVAQLKVDGVHVMTPDVGPMACGEFGPGRFPEPERIAQEIRKLLAPPKGAGPLAGVRAVVTAGPTREPLDPVRFISNHSSGKQGYAIADALARLGADVRLVTGPTQLPIPDTVTGVKVETALEMQDAVKANFPADIFVSVAAVADWRPATRAKTKLKLKGGKTENLDLHLVENPDILRSIGTTKKGRPRLVVGFAAETNDVEKNAKAKLTRKGADWIVANDVSGDVMGGADNEVLLVTKSATDRWPRMSKAEVAMKLADRIAQSFVQSGAKAQPSTKTKTSAAE